MRATEVVGASRRAESRGVAASIVPLAGRRRRRRTNELRIEPTQLVLDVSSRLRSPYVAPLDEVAGVAELGGRANRPLDPECRLLRRPQVPSVVDDPRRAPDLMIVLRRTGPAPAWRSVTPSRWHPTIDGLRIRAADRGEALTALARAGLPVSDAPSLLEATIGREPDPERVRLAVATRRRIHRLMLTGGIGMTLLLVALLATIPGSLLSGGGCPDWSPSPVAAVTQPVLEPIDDSSLVAGGTRTVEDVLDGRARHDDLLAAADKAGATSGWSETWRFADGDELTLDRITFATPQGALSYGEYDTRIGCHHRIASHALGAGLTAVQSDRPGAADGWEAVVVDDSDVHRVYIVSEDQDDALSRLRAAARIIRSG